MDEVERQIQKLKNPNPYARENAANALRDLLDDRAALPLRKSLNDRNHFVVWSAAKALFAIVHHSEDHELLGIYNNACIMAMRESMRSICNESKISNSENWKKRTVPMLIDGLRSFDSEIKRFAAKSLVTIGKATLPYLFESLKCTTSNTYAVLEVMACFNDPRVFPSLIEHMNNDEQHKTIAKHILKVYFDKNGTNPKEFDLLINLYRGAKTCRETSNAILALGSTGDISTIPLVKKSLGSSELQVNNALIAYFQNLVRKNIGSGKTGDALSILASFTVHPVQTVRFNASSSLRHILLNCTSISELKEFEDGVNAYLKTKKKPSDTLMKIKISISAMKNKLAKDKGILLDDIPKPPKRNRMYQQIRRVSNA